jgi:AraC family transcriptional regulator
MSSQSPLLEREFGSGKAGRELDVPSLIAELLLKATQAIDGDSEVAHNCIRSAAALVDDLARQTLPGPTGRSACPAGLAPWQTNRVKAYVAENIERPIALCELARLVRLSNSHFSRAFKRSFGIAPHAYIVLRRINEAQRLMLTTAEPLSRVAVACGFADQSHFSRQFSRAVGQSPRAWQRLCSGGVE